MKSLMTSALETEIEINAQWRLDPAYKGRRIHDELLRQEFLSRAELTAQRDLLLRRQLEHCFDTVPYYQSLFSRSGIKREQLRDPAMLQQLPVLTKADVSANKAALVSRQPPPGNGFLGSTETSGTTGEPLIVSQSERSMGLFRWLKQREYRWYRFDPGGVLLQIRPPMDLPRPDKDRMIRRDEVLRVPRWTMMDSLFMTGPMWGFSNINSVEAQSELVEKVRPNYLLMQATCLEHLSLQKFNQKVHEQLGGALSISQTLTPAMRTLIEESLRCPVKQNYGLNEIGLVASECHEGGRYHAHVENCLVELLDAGNKPVESGSKGRLVVTSLSNAAMPLLRYETGDTMLAVEPDCSCGKSLPAFAAVQGRYRRAACLPAGTFQRWASI